MPVTYKPRAFSPFGTTVRLTVTRLTQLRDLQRVQLHLERYRIVRRLPVNSREGAYTPIREYLFSLRTFPYRFGAWFRVVAR